MEIFGQNKRTKGHPKVLEETDWKRGQFQRNLSRRTTDIQNMTAITGKQITGQHDERKDTRNEKGE